ncbi:MAG: hypothetical protein MZV70_70700 [Desulfobacterales bacterium]|nr:hypothetical protein [Desulfobacterales bacterium]
MAIVASAEGGGARLFESARRGEEMPLGRGAARPVRGGLDAPGGLQGPQGPHPRGPQRRVRHAGDGPDGRPSRRPSPDPRGRDRGRVRRRLRRREQPGRGVRGGGDLQPRGFPAAGHCAGRALTAFRTAGLASSPGTASPGRSA